MSNLVNHDYIEYRDRYCKRYIVNKINRYYLILHLKVNNRSNEGHCLLEWSIAFFVQINNDQQCVSIVTQFCADRSDIPACVQEEHCKRLISMVIGFFESWPPMFTYNRPRYHQWKQKAPHVKAPHVKALRFLLRYSTMLVRPNRNKNMFSVPVRLLLRDSLPFF